MAKLMKDRTDNDIKNKWNSMKRTQRLNESRYGVASIPMSQTAPETYSKPGTSGAQQSNCTGRVGVQEAKSDAAATISSAESRDESETLDDAADGMDPVASSSFWV